MARIKVMELIPSLDPIGGGQTLFTNLCEEYAKKYKNEVDLVAVFLYPKKENYLYRKIEELGVLQYSFNKKVGLDLRCVRDLRRLIKEIKPDVIHSHLSATKTLFLATFLRKKPVLVHTIHHMVGPGFMRERFNVMLSKFRYIYPVCVGLQSSLSMSKYVGRPVPYVNNGINVERFRNDNPVSNREIDFLSVASLTSVKNHSFLLDCFAAFHETHPDSNLFLAGTGPLKEEIEKQIVDLGAEKYIKMLGHVEDTSHLMGNSKILLMPSLSEGNPMVINEAICSGMYVIGSRVGGIPDLINDRSKGALFDSGNREGFLKAMEIVDHSETLESYRLENKDALGDYDIAKSAQSYFQIFASLMWGK